MYDGFALFHQFHIEGLGYRGIGFGEALDFYQTDISIHGPNPVLPSGGNIGCGRSRIWMHTDCMQQIQTTRGGAPSDRGEARGRGFRRADAPRRQLLGGGAPRPTDHGHHVLEER